jgi:hypothetical protein
VQLKQFYKNQSIKQILCSQTNNGAAFVPDSETRAQICKPFKEPRNRFPALRASAKPLFEVSARQAT